MRSTLNASVYLLQISSSILSTPARKRDTHNRPRKFDQGHSP